MTCLLQIRDLKVGFSGTEVLHGISLEVARGKKLGLVGESGSGKSITALSVMRLVKDATTSGAILLDGEDVLAMRRRRLEKVRGGKVAMIYQDPMSSLNPVHTVGRQLRESLLLHTDLGRRAAWERAAELLAEVGVARPRERLDAYPHEFSGGMRQRVMIAMALCGEPELLIADEPTTALDVTTQARIIDLLDRIVDTHGTGVMLITHDLGVAAGFCDEIAVMRHGQIVERAEAEVLYASPQHPYTRALLGAVVDLNTDVTRPIPTLDSVTEPVTKGLDAPGAALEEGRPDDVLLRVDSAVKTFALGRERITAVDQISFEIKRGQTFGLVGESGSGKSTVSRCALALTPLDSGRVEFDGIDVAGQRGAVLRRLRRRMQMVFQDPFSALNRRHTVETLISAPLLAHGIGDRAEREERVNEMLRLVGLGPQFRKRLPREMSGGQCQRVAIARSLVLRPEFVVLDESVSALDVSIRAQILNLLRDLQGEFGLTYLFVSHDLGVVRYMCNEIAVMRAGKIVEHAGRDELFADPKHEYTRSLLAAVPMADPRVEKARRRRAVEQVASS